jgi:putative addiction module component (TIGR02574 family)
MLSTAEIIREIDFLPVEERILLVDTLLRSLNPPDTGINQQWIEVVRRRRTELQSGEVKGISGEVVLARLRARFLG